MYTFDELYEIVINDPDFEYKKTIKEPEFETFQYDGIEFFVDKQISAPIVLQYYQQIREILGNPTPLYNGRLYVCSHPPSFTMRGRNAASVSGKQTSQGPCLILMV